MGTHRDDASITLASTAKASPSASGKSSQKGLVFPRVNPRPCSGGSLARQPVSRHGAKQPSADRANPAYCSFSFFLSPIWFVEYASFRHEKQKHQMEKYSLQYKSSKMFQSADERAFCPSRARKPWNYCRHNPINRARLALKNSELPIGIL